MTRFPVRRADSQTRSRGVSGTRPAKKMEPREVEIEGLAQFNTHYGDMTVNAYLVLGSKEPRCGRVRYRRRLQ